MRALEAGAKRRQEGRESPVLASQEGPSVSQVEGAENIVGRTALDEVEPEEFDVGGGETEDGFADQIERCGIDPLRNRSITL